jgi:type I restriction enzyme S subunit
MSQAKLDKFQEGDPSEASYDLLPDDIPQSWKIVPIEEIIVSDNTRVDPEKSPDLKYISLKHLDKGSPRTNECGVASEVSSKKYRFKEGDILFGKLRPNFRKVILAEYEGVCSTDITVIRPEEGIDRDFLHYTLFRQDLINIADKTSTGTRMPRADWDVLDEVLVALPPLSEQKRIGRALWSIDELIQKNREQIDIISELVSEIFEHRFIKETSENWQSTDFGEIVEMHSGGPRKSTDQFIGDEHKWLTPTDVTSTNSPIVVDTERKLNDAALEETSVSVLPEGTVMLTSRATVGEVVVTGAPMAMNQGFIALTPMEDVPPYFLTELVKSKRPIIENLASGSTYSEISQSDFASIEITLPPVDEINEYEEKVTPFYKQIQENLNQIELLSELREQLLPKLLNGHLRLEEK